MSWRYGENVKHEIYSINFIVFDSYDCSLKTNYYNSSTKTRTPKSPSLGLRSEHLPVLLHFNRAPLRDCSQLVSINFKYFLPFHLIYEGILLIIIEWVYIDFHSIQFIWSWVYYLFDIWVLLWNGIIIWNMYINVTIKYHSTIWTTRLKWISLIWIQQYKISNL